MPVTTNDNCACEIRREIRDSIWQPFVAGCDPLQIFKKTHLEANIDINNTTMEPHRINASMNPNQMLPLFVKETMSSYPGITGLFVAALFSGALRSVKGS